MLAFCGLQCDTCPIFLATLEKEKSKQFEMRESIAEECREHYNMEISLEEITDCDGCRAESGRLFSGCQKCEIRKCVVEKQIENCAFCSQFACSKLEDLFILDPYAKIRLMEIRDAN